MKWGAMAACLCLVVGVLVPLANSLFNAKGGGDFQDGVPAEPALIYFQGALYQCVYAVHEDTYHTHFHFVFNPVSFVDGHKYSGTKEEHHDLKRLLRRHLDRHGIKMFYEVKYRPEAQDPYE